MATMGMAAVATVIWPALAGLVSGVLVAVLCASGAVLAAFAARWIRGELECRRELRTMPPIDAATDGAAPKLAELREPA